MKIAIIDYGMCNIDSVSKAVEKSGGISVVTDEVSSIQICDGIILPGVGSFKDAMHELEIRGLKNVLREMVLVENVPFLGICLGMHLMASQGTEGGLTSGLDLLEGKVVRIVPKENDIRVPHVGWNEVEIEKKSSIFNNIKNNTDFYFVHSFHFVCKKEFVIACTPYNGKFISAIGRNKCFGVQFHPEKSLKNGLQLIENFVQLC